MSQIAWYVVYHSAISPKKLFAVSIFLVKSDFIYFIFALIFQKFQLTMDLAVQSRRRNHWWPQTEGEMR